MESGVFTASSLKVPSFGRWRSVHEQFVAGFSDPDGVMTREILPAVRCLVCSSLEDFSLLSGLPGTVTTSPEFPGTALKMDLKSRVPKLGWNVPPISRTISFYIKSKWQQFLSATPRAQHHCLHADNYLSFHHSTRICSLAFVTTVSTLSSLLVNEPKLSLL